MLDLRQIREDPQPAREALARRGVDPAILDEALELDERRRALLPELEDLRARKNQASKRIGELQRSGEDASEAIAETRGLSEREKQLEEELRDVEERRTAALRSLPNLPDPTAPRRGRGDPRGRRVRQDGSQPRGAARRRPRHRARRARVGLALRVPEGAAGAGSSSRSCSGRCRCLEERGFTPVITPVLVREQALYGTGFLPDTEQQLYRVPEDDLYLVGTSEVPLASYHAGEILSGGELPLPLRRLLHLLPARGRRGGQGHAGPLPRAPVRQGRDVHVRGARGVAGRARAAARHRGGDPPGARDPVPGGEHRGRRPRARRPPRSTTWRRGCRARAASASSPRARTRPTSRRAGSRCATARRRARACATCTR